jgi:hypothetical protein
VYRQGKDYSNAESLYQRALIVLEKTLGVRHIEVSKTLVGFANLYAETAAYEHAEPLYERALAILEEITGAESVDTEQFRDHVPPHGLLRSSQDAA